MRARTLAIAVVVLGLLVGAAPASANGPAVRGAGSTWVKIALDQWRADIAQRGIDIEYSGYGSSAGRSFFILNQVDFAASEIPFQPDEIPALQAAHMSWQYVPDVAGGTSLMYNLHQPGGARITSLRLDAAASAAIFTGRITSWHDPAIQALNPGLQIAENDITAVVRSDGSGTSAQFSLYLEDQAPGVWADYVRANGCPAPCSIWIQGAIGSFLNAYQANGSDGVAEHVAQYSGSMGYVEAGYAFGRGFPVASLRNASGNFTQPRSNNVAIALTHARLHADLTQDLRDVYRAPEATAYPMSSYSYLITRTTGFDPAKGYVLGTWMIYIACGGQREAPLLGYSPLPPNLVAFVFDAVRRIPGAPNPPPLDAQHCSNPTITSGSSTGVIGGTTASPTPAASTAATAANGNGTGTATGTASASSTAGPAATSAAAVEAQAALGQSSGNGTVAGLMVNTLDDKQRQASFALAEQVAGATSPSADRGLVIAGALLVLVVFTPILFGFRHRRREQGGKK